MVDDIRLADILYQQGDHMSNVYETLLPLARGHQEADEYLKGVYWNWRYKKGCSIGCTIEDTNRLELTDCDNDDHEALADLLYGGVTQIAHLQDHIFEGLPDSSSRTWTVRLLEACAKNPRVNWQAVLHTWYASVLDDLLKLQPVIVNQQVSEATSTIRDLHVSKSTDRLVWRVAALAVVDARGSYESQEWTVQRGVVQFANMASYHAATDPIINVAVDFATNAASGFAVGGTTGYGAARAAAYERMADQLIEAILE